MQFLPTSRYARGASLFKAGSSALYWMMNMTFLIRKVEINGLRGLKGEVEFNRGLNLIIGQNNSGKTTILEAILSSLLLSLEDLAHIMDNFMVLEAARGNLKCSLAFIVPNGSGHVCSIVETNDSTSKECIEISKRKKGLTLPILKVPMTSIRAVVSIENKERKKRVDISPKETSLRVHLEENSSDKPLINAKVGVVPSGILPYNRTECMLEYLRDHNPNSLVTIKLGRKEYGLKLGTDEFGDPLAFVKHGNELIPFYSVGKGLQRAFQILMSGMLYDILMIDVIENAMHPELLAQVVENLVNLAKDKQIILTTQSLEAAFMLASSFLGLKPTTDREAILHKIEEQGDLEGFNLVITDVRDGKLLSATLRGKIALRRIAGSEDVRSTLLED